MRAMTLRLPDEVHEALRKEAYESRRSMNELVLKALSGRAAIWDEAAKWVLVEADLLTEHQPLDAWLAPHENPYRDGSK